MADTKEAADAVAQVARAVSGPETPEAATLASKPSARALWALVLAGPAISAMLVGVVLILSLVFWPDVVAWGSEELAGKIIWALTVVVCILAALLGLVVFRLASGGLKSIRASAGAGSIEVDAGDD